MAHWPPLHGPEAVADLVKRLREFDIRSVGPIHDTEALRLLIGEAADALEYLESRNP